MVVGMFGEAGEEVAPRVAFFDGVPWEHLGVPDHNVHGPTVWNGDLVITGDFTSISGQALFHIARYGGSQWHRIGSGAGGSCVEVYQGQLYAGGLGNPRRWNGASWETFGQPVFGWTYDMHVHGGELWIGGSLNECAGTDKYLLRWNGAALAGLPIGPNDTVRTIGNYQGDLVIGGEFTTVAGVAAVNIARFDGTTWTGFGSGVQGESVLCVEQVNDDLFVGGNYTTGSGAQHSFL